jgi:hypothetical protein
MDKVLSWLDYNYMWGAILDYKKDNGRLPNYIDWKGLRVYKVAYQDAARRVIEYRASHSGTNPDTVRVSGTDLSQPMSFTTWYNSMIGIGYAHYFGDRYNAVQEENNIANHIAMNCSDYSQKAVEKARSWGYEARYIHRICQSGTGHVLIQIRGREFNNWTYADVAAAASIGSKFPLGKTWCPSPRKEWVSTEPWLTSNDGKT